MIINPDEPKLPTKYTCSMICVKSTRIKQTPPRSSVGLDDRTKAWVPERKARRSFSARFLQILVLYDSYSRTEMSSHVKWVVNKTTSFCFHIQGGKISKDTVKRALGPGEGIELIGGDT